MAPGKFSRRRLRFVSAACPQRHQSTAHRPASGAPKPVVEACRACAGGADATRMAVAIGLAILACRARCSSTDRAALIGATASAARALSARGRRGEGSSVLSIGRQPHARLDVEAVGKDEQRVWPRRIGEGIGGDSNDVAADRAGSAEDGRIDRARDRHVAGEYRSADPSPEASNAIRPHAALPSDAHGSASINTRKPRPVLHAIALLR